MFGFVTCNNLATVNISCKIRTVLLYGCEVSKDGMAVSANFKRLK